MSIDDLIREPTVEARLRTDDPAFATLGRWRSLRFGRVAFAGQNNSTAGSAALSSASQVAPLLLFFTVAERGRTRHMPAPSKPQTCVDQQT